MELSPEGSRSQGWNIKFARGENLLTWEYFQRPRNSWPGLNLRQKMCRSKIGEKTKDEGFIGHDENTGLDSLS